MYINMSLSVLFLSFYIHNYLVLASSVNLFQHVPQEYFPPAPGAMFEKASQSKKS